MIRLDQRTTSFPLLPGARLPLKGGRSKFLWKDNGLCPDLGSVSCCPQEHGWPRGALFVIERLWAGSHGRKDQRHPPRQLHRQQPTA